MSKELIQAQRDYTMLYFVKDPANLCSLTGLLASFFAIYFAVTKQHHYALACALWAVVFDWLDGRIARRLKNRSDYHRAIGVQMDSLIDIVSFGVFPAFFLLSYGNFGPVFMPGASMIVAAAAVRLSYFNVFGMIDKNTYKGLALDNDVIILGLIFILEKFLPQQSFSIFLYLALILLAVFNLAPVPTPKLGDKWLPVLFVYTLVMSVYYIIFY